MTTFHVYTDPGHGWLKVTHKQLKESGVADQISRYSYMTHKAIFLEEDCDAPKFLAAFRSQGGTVKFKTHYASRESRIRTYPSFYAPFLGKAWKVGDTGRIWGTEEPFTVVMERPTQFVIQTDFGMKYSFAKVQSSAHFSVE